ncbi:hypothetical protein V7O66_03075 [Methanolobus sp. ZRKC3]|uniref:hypothetical protein n=1 Tax=Methanolobus sp. ZRKC3 TaxID=3125786 RepID=UPI00324418A2
MKYIVSHKLYAIKYIVFHMAVNRKTLVKAGTARCVFQNYKQLPITHPDKPAFAAALATITAESLGGILHTYSDDNSTPFTLLVSKWNESSSPKAVLVKKSISNWTTAVSFWNIANQNLFRRNEGFEELENIDRIIMKSTYELWTKTPRGSPVRWAEAARIYEESCLAALEGLWFADDDFEKWNNQLNDLKPRLLNVLGYDSVLEITSKRSDKAFPTEFLREVLFAGGNEQSLTKMAYSCIAKPLPTHIPIEVLRNRGDLSPTQALASYLVDDEYGPKLTYAAAANLLGMKNRQEIGTHLKRARNILQNSGQDARTSRSVRSKNFNKQAPEAIEVSILPLKDERFNDFDN